MSTHILSDVEALCDEVAILRNGRLAATGKLDDLLESHGEIQSFEIIIKGITAEQLNGALTTIPGASILTKASGSAVQVPDEQHIETVLQAVRASGGRLASVQPVKQSLEELFVEKTINN